MLSSSKSSAWPCLAAVVAWLALRDGDPALQMAVLVFVAGLYVLAAVEDMLGEAHDSAKDRHWSALSLIAGFTLFLVVSGGPA